MVPGPPPPGYDILELIGAGAVGEVYRARDQRLGRDVALKFLSSRFAADPVRLKRFEREARALAALGHPNVATIHGMEEHSGSVVLVLELVPGETLRERLDRGPMSLDEALDACTQVAAGLAAAHGAGIVHRDVKPSNIRIRPDGIVKLLDFGLAKALAPESLDGERDDPTWTRDASLHDAVLGTPGYLAPEQAAGGPVDRRADAWAFGCVLYEALSGRPAFPGASGAERIAAVLKDEPDLARLPPGTPPTVRDLVASALRKDPEERLRDLDDARVLIERARSAGSWAAPPGRRGRAGLAALSLAGLLVAAALAVKAWPGGPRGGEAPTYLGVPLSEPPELDFGGALDVSADGRRIAYSSGDERAWVRDLGSPAWRLIEVGYAPFLSPDGRWLGGFGWQLNKMSAEGGLRVPLDAPVTLAVGGCWLPDESILYAPGLAGPILRRAPDGSIETVTALDASRSETSHRWPHPLPDGEGFVYTAKAATTASFDDAAIRLHLFASGEDRVLVEGGSDGRVSAGHLLFTRAGELLAVELDTRTRTVRGAPRSVLKGVVTNPATGAAFLALSRTGDLAYFAGPPREKLAELAWVDATGEVRTTDVRMPVHQAVLSPDGRHVVLVRYGANDKLWLADLEAGWQRQLTFGPGNDHDPAFSPDGTRVAYLSDRGGEWSIRMVDAGGTGEDEELVPANPDLRTSGLGSTPEGLVFVVAGPTPRDPSTIRVLPWDGSAVRDVAVRHELVLYGALSPDGAWLAYSGTVNNYVEAFPGPGPRLVLPMTGRPRWSRDGRSIAYASQEPVPGSVWVADFDPGPPAPRLGAPRLVTALQRPELVGMRDGEILALVREPEAVPQMHLVTNFTSLLREGGVAETDR